MELTRQQLDAARAFLAQVRERARIDGAESLAAAQTWIKGLNYWTKCQLSGDDKHTAVWWYHYRHDPGSKEWRPAIILRALVRASERDYIEPGQMKPNDVALNATPTQKKRARMLFIRSRGFGTFQEKVRPILRRGGTRALFETPATPEIREYVTILAGLASKTL